MNEPNEQSPGVPQNETVRMQLAGNHPPGSEAREGGMRTVRIVSDKSPEAQLAGGDSLFSQYAVVSRIGDGGMGVVYLARDRRLGRYVAIKRLNRQAQSIPSLHQRFLLEARAVAALNHIHIVHMYALGEDADGPYIVMEYVAGPDGLTLRAPDEVTQGDARLPSLPLTLDQHITRNGQLTVADAISLLVKIGRTVAYAHENGVIHRDLKPSNILLDKSGEPKIVDFGLARLLRIEENKLTVPGEKLLSMGYGSPEQEQDASLTDERSDVYGLGAILYFTITGQNPRYFREQDIPLVLREVLVKALATDREQRWPSAAAFTEALHAVQTKTRIETPTVKTTWRCKWCDTVNPLTIRYCAECGWDGGEPCTECGADSFVGVQYCGTCGADSRAYESVKHLLERMRSAVERHQYERAVAFAGRAHVFEPAGPAGRHLVKAIHDLREQSERAITQRERLKELIPIELKAENYERAQTFIREYRELSGDTLAFGDDERRLAEQTVRRDLSRAQLFIKSGEWGTAERICLELLESVAPGDAACQALLRRIRTQRWSLWIVRGAASLLALVLAYVLSLAPAFSFSDGKPSSGLRRVYGVALTLHTQGVFSPALRGYARWWGVTRFEEETIPAGGQPDAFPPPAELPELLNLQRVFMQQREELAVEQRQFDAAWPDAYRRELVALIERRQVAGDYDGVIATQAEIQEFQNTRQIGSAPTTEFDDLDTLREKYRRMLNEQKIGRERKRIALSRKYTNDLNDLLRSHTREGRLEIAAVINAAIKRERGSADLLEAEAELAKLPDGASDVAPKVVGGAPSATGLNELQARRQALDAKLTEIEQEYETQRAQWPEQYSEALKALMSKCQKEGDYFGWESANTEHERLLIDRRLTEAHAVIGPAPLLALQMRNIQHLQEIGKRRSQAVRKLFDGHTSKLDEWKKTLTRAGEMELAAAVNAEMRQLLSRQEYVAALRDLTPPPVASTPSPSTGNGAQSPK
ncbi:MAG: hypothetical protein FJ222_04755 [Lentisphaerae bacterium]|nr:hypothetical protein [Lentisphaerota bacterium]